MFLSHGCFYLSLSVHPSEINKNILQKKIKIRALARCSVGWSVVLYTKRLVGLMPGWGVDGRQLTDVTLTSMFFSL